MPKAKIIGFSSITQTNESIAVKFGDSITLRDPIATDETNEEWYLSRGGKVLTIYENGKLNPSNDVDMNNVKCLPTIDNCEALMITNFTKKWIGQVLRQSKKDKLSIVTYHFLLTGYEPPLRVICPSDKQYACQYNATTNSVSVRENKVVSLGEKINRIKMILVI